MAWITKTTKIVDFLFPYRRISVGMLFPSCSCVNVLAWFLQVLCCKVSLLLLGLKCLHGGILSCITFFHLCAVLSVLLDPWRLLLFTSLRWFSVASAVLITSPIHASVWCDLLWNPCLYLLVVSFWIPSRAYYFRLCFVIGQLCELDLYTFIQLSYNKFYKYWKQNASELWF